MTVVRVRVLDYHLVLIAALTVLVINGAAEKGSIFIEDIIRFYGKNGTLSTADLDNILEKLGTREPSLIEDVNSSVHSKCPTGAEILSQYGLPSNTHLSATHLESICPAILSQAVLPPCPLTPPSHLKPTDLQVWGYGILAVTIINLSSLLGLTLIPFTQKPCFPKVLTFFIGLAIGTLFSNAVLQLIPEALGFDPKSDNYVLKAVGIFGGFYFLFFVERILKMVLKTDHQHSHNHVEPPENPRDNTLQNGDLGSNVEAITIIGSGEERASVMSGLSTQRGAQRGGCRWLRGERLSRIRTVAWMVSLSDALHNFTDGLVIGASFSVSVLSGFSTSIAIVCEEFPHELGDFVILLNSGMSVPQAAFFNLLSAMSCYLGLALGILVGRNFAPNVIFAIAGGMFLYIALADMFPEMNSILSGQERTTKNQVTFFLIQNIGLLTGFSIILLITMFAGDIALG